MPNQDRKPAHLSRVNLAPLELDQPLAHGAQLFPRLALVQHRTSIRPLARYRRRRRWVSDIVRERAGRPVAHHYPSRALDIGITVLRVSAEPNTRPRTRDSPFVLGHWLEPAPKGTHQGLQP